jgi:hypothetical protein
MNRAPRQRTTLPLRDPHSGYRLSQTPFTGVVCPLFPSVISTGTSRPFSDPLIYSLSFGRDVVRRNCGRSVIMRRFNRLARNAAAFIPTQRSQQKIYRVAIFGPCRIAAPEDVPA